MSEIIKECQICNRKMTDDYLEEVPTPLGKYDVCCQCAAKLYMTTRQCISQIKETTSINQVKL